MAKTLIGNIKGPQGEQGEKGPQGIQGEKGATGSRGSRWTTGTAITGTATTGTVFSGTGITDALVNDMYLNASTGNTYRCTLAGNASTAKWVYAGNIKGPQGEQGEKGNTGATGPQGATGAKGEKGDSGTADTTFSKVASDTELVSGEDFNTLLGKIAKIVSSYILHVKAKATSSVIGHVLLTNAATVTATGSYALDAIEKNPDVEGTLAAEINEVNDRSVSTTEEKAIGKWIDGKTIYKKCFVGNLPKSANTAIFRANDVNLSINGILINYKGSISINDTYKDCIGDIFFNTDGSLNRSSSVQSQPQSNRAALRANQGGNVTFYEGAFYSIELLYVR